MSIDRHKFSYPFTATTVIARRLAPLLLFTLGAGLLIWAGREFYYWKRPWAVLPEAALGLLSWAAAAYFYTLLPEVRADEAGLKVRRWGPFWREIPWGRVAGVERTAQVDLLGWVESLYTVYAWRPVAGRRGRVRRTWHRRRRAAFRFSGHVRNCQRLIDLVEARAAGDGEADESEPGPGGATDGG
jgi:hypothetical protein